MPKRHKYGELALPAGWDIATDYDGKIYYIDHNNKETTWLDPRDRYTKPQTFADCIGDELPLGWEEGYDPHIGRYYVNHIDQTTQLEDPRQEWKSVQKAMLREYLNAAQDVLEAKREIFDVKQQRLLVAQDEYKHLNTLAASRSSLCSSSCSINTRHDPDLLRAELILAKQRVSQLRQEIVNITSDISYTQRGVETLHSVEEKLNAHENGCYNISEVQAIREEMIKVQKSLISGEKVREELMRSLLQIKNELTRQQFCEDGSDMHAVGGYGAINDRVCVASQTDLCADNVNSGARFAEMAKTKLQYSEWRKRIKQLQQQLVEHVEKIEPGQLESDKDRLLLIQEKEKLLKELRCISINSKQPEEVITIQQTCKKLEEDLRNAYEATNQCIANRLRLHDEKQLLLDKLQEAVKSSKLLEDRLRSFSSGSTFSISSGSSLSLSTASSKSALSFTDIYGDLLTVDPQIDIAELHRRTQRLSHPSEVSLSSRSSLSMETPPASPMKLNDGQSKAEPTYANASNFSVQINSDLDSASLDRMRLEETLHELKMKQPLSPIYEKPSLLDLPQDMLSRSSSTSNTRSVSAAVSNESVAGDSGVFEASRVYMPSKELAQVQIGLKYMKSECILTVSIERASNLVALHLTDNCQIYLSAALLPNCLQSIRTKSVSEFQRPVFGESFSFQISLNKIFSKILQVTVISVKGQREEIIGTIQISLAEFNPDDSTLKWYNILSSRFMPNLRYDSMEISGACREESSDESTIISSQTSTLTRNQAPHVDIQGELAEELKEHLQLNEAEEEEEEEDDDDNEEEEEEEEEEAEVDENHQVDKAQANENESYNENANPENQMLDETSSKTAAINEFVDKETNTECAFPPEKSRVRHFDTKDAANGGGASSTTDDRPVKRSQTFSPSAAVNKNRYICRLNRSDSDSAMHFGGAVHPFQRGAVERRSLRFHTKVPKPVTKTHHTHMIPRTSLDLELDLQAQHSKLDTLNDEITKLRNLKERLEQARDNKDAKIANWAIENEDFQRLVECVDTSTTPEEKKVKKLLHKTSKEIYKLRKTKVSKGAPDLVTFKEKMAFFTRKGLPVPEVPAELSVPEESSAIENVVVTQTTNPSLQRLGSEKSVKDLHQKCTSASSVEGLSSIEEGATAIVNGNPTTPPTDETNERRNSGNYKYVIDRTYGVEV